MAKRPQAGTHAKARQAYVLGQISKWEYQLCICGGAWVERLYIRIPDFRGRVTMRRLISK